MAILLKFQVHFESSQFEKVRADGKKKLKWNAVPTLNLSTTEPSHPRVFGDITNIVTSQVKFHST
jgi:hypothetical protein